MQKKISKQNNYYFSDKLKRRLDQISQHPLTVVEAPSGFGKTTAVREYFKKNLPHRAREYWYTCLGEPASIAWMGICNLFSNVNNKVANDLRNLKMPTMDTLFYMATYLRDIYCETETYLVVDNYQLINCDILSELISVFSMHENPKLHMIFITQQLEVKQQISIHNSSIYNIDAASFFFNREGTFSLFQMEGIHLTDDELEKIFMSTEGWVSAIRLQMINFIETGSLELATDIEKLVEKAIWNNLTSEEKDFLLSVSVLKSFTVRQAAIMLNQDTIPERIEEFLKNNDFIKYLPDKHLYSIHSILQNYLQNRLYDQMPEAYHRQIFYKAGVACASISQYFPAAEFFYKLRDFDSIFSLPFSREYLDEQKEKMSIVFFTTLINECPDEILCKYPFTMIVFGYLTLMRGHFNEYQKLCRLICHVIQNEMGFNQEQLRKIDGEYAVLASLGEFNDIDKMRKLQQRAWELLEKPTDMIKSNTPWLFGSTSVLSMLWRESGNLENVLKQMNESKSLYHKLACGHGAGSGYLIKAEAMLMQGEDNKAEILCHKALYSARSYHQIDICICAELVLARIAILRGDVENYFAVIKNIQDYARQNSSIYILRIVEYCMSIISLVLQVKDYVAPWFYDIESIKKVLNAPVIPHALLLHLRLLLMDKHYNEFYGVCQIALDESRNQTGNIKYMMPQLYQLIFLTVAKFNNGDYLEAQEYLKQALVIALPDKIYLPFSIIVRTSNSVLESLKSSTTDKNSINALIELGRRQERGTKTIRKAIISHKSPLTPREREIALLARRRLSAREIAVELYISEKTVRTILRSVYSKLDIHSKTELANKEF